MKKLKIFLAETSDFNPDVLYLIKDKFNVISFSNETPLRNILNDVDIFWFRLGYKIDNNVLDKNSKCKYLVTPVTGIDHIDENYCKELGVKVICLRGESEFLKTVRATAELTIALNLALIRNLVDAINDTRKGEWRRDSFRGNELFLKKVGIIGFGRLGRIVAGYYKTFGCEVGYYDILNIEALEYKKHEDLDALLKESDIVTLHVNYNSQNHQFFGKEHFNLMKRDSIFINTSRGGLVDEKALLDSLKSGQIAGAALDVLASEPEILNNNLIKYSAEHNNLIISPHIGGNTFESFEKTEFFIFEKLISVIDGK